MNIEEAAALAKESADYWAGTANPDTAANPTSWPSIKPDYPLRLHADDVALLLRLEAQMKRVEVKLNEAIQMLGRMGDSY